MISVIVPAYNSERWLAACIDSILSQSCRDFELLIIDDGSTDGTGKICDDYAAHDKRIRVFHTPNGGLSAARNHGLDNMRGEYVCFVDSDDILLPGALDTLLNVIENTGADIAEGSVIAGVTPDDSRLQYTHPPKVRTFTSTEAMELCLYRKTLHNGAWGKLYRSSIFDKLRFTPGLIYEDVDLTYRIHDRSRLAALTSEPVYFYRKGHASITGVFNARRLDVLKVVEKMERYIALHHPELLPAAHDRALGAYFNMFRLITVNKADLPDALNRCWAGIKLHRHESLLNPKVRIKNKAGIILSYLGRNVFSFICRHVRQ